MITVNLIISTILAILGFQIPKVGSDVTEEIIKNGFDFVIVGAGSAGSVVATRLSEDLNITVLLVEAGESPTFKTEIPGYAGQVLSSTADWRFKTTPQTHSCLAYKNKQCSYPRGKVLGGSSILNGMIYARGNPRDYDHWASLGNEGWSWEDVLPYFLKSEGNTIPWMINDTIYHNSMGELTISEAPFSIPLLNSFLEAGQENGYPIRDVNGRYQSGVMPTAFTMRNGARCSTYKAFLNPALTRDNLKVITNSHVLKVVFDNETRAIGVSFSHESKQYIVKAHKEVILSAGAIGSPHILMLSGVGPAAHLNQFKIPIIADLPGVGRNLYDHVGSGGLVWTVNTSTTLDEREIQSTRSLLQWIRFREGPLTVPYGLGGIGFVSSSHENSTDDWPDTQIIYQFPSTSPAKSFIQINESQKLFSIMPIILRPKSVGSIQLQSSDPFANPLIDLGYFTHPDDLQTIIEATKFCLQLADSSSFRKSDTQFVPYTVPGCENYTQYSDEYWACTARHLTIAGLHAVGSCKMGTAEDNKAVVNSQLKVYKVKGLRVIDASIMPYIVSGNTNAPTIMIGEKGSHFIKTEWDFM